jgi:hypothetical protein
MAVLSPSGSRPLRTGAMTAHPSLGTRAYRQGQDRRTFAHEGDPFCAVLMCAAVRGRRLGTASLQVLGDGVRALPYGLCAPRGR